MNDLSFYKAAAELADAHMIKANPGNPDQLTPLGVCAVVRATAKLNHDPFFEKDEAFSSEVKRLRLSANQQDILDQDDKIDLICKVMKDPSFKDTFPILYAVTQQLSQDIYGQKFCFSDAAICLFAMWCYAFDKGNQLLEETRLAYQRIDGYFIQDGILTDAGEYLFGLCESCLQQTEYEKLESKDQDMFEFMFSFELAKQAERLLSFAGQVGILPDNRQWIELISGKLPGFPLMADLYRLMQLEVQMIFLDSSDLAPLAEAFRIWVNEEAKNPKSYRELTHKK